MNLRTNLSELKGVGKKTAQKLQLAGLKTVKDIVNYLPRSYNDYSTISSISNLSPGKVTIKARVESVNTRYIRRNMQITTATLTDDNNNKVRAVWFNQPYRQKMLEKDTAFYFSGDFALKRGRYQITNPSFEVCNNLILSSGKIIPIYPRKLDLKPAIISRIIKDLKPLISLLPETLPDAIIKKRGLISRSEALLKIHFPENTADLKEAKYRLGFDELLNLILAAKLNRLDSQKLKGYNIKFNKDKIKAFVDSLDFKLTADQKRATWEILQDFMLKKPMGRLLQGDVGSGKTVVAAITAYQAFLGGYQIAIMAPTEVLAMQHLKTIKDIMSNYPVNIDILTSSTSRSQRQKTLDDLKTGKINIIIGTHALLQPDVTFKNLGYAIIDEQHRFGVKQRQELIKKTDLEHLPHLLSMTATPIPRSLQLTLFGDLDISTISELPGKRKPIATKIILPNEKPGLIDLIQKELADGRQAYFIAPLVEGSELNTKISVDALYKKIVKTFPKYKIGLLHGKLPAKNKNSIMTSFKNHQIDILVSTTVIEVGVDVPNASVIVIEDADNFGLAQLHQLRGRVGRGSHKSYCYLIQNDTKEPSKRLKEIEHSNDGFYLSEIDLKLRGAGEIYGTAQHGDINLKIASLADTRLIKSASDAANEIVSAIKLNPDYLLKYPEIAKIVKRYQKITTLN